MPFILDRVLKGFVRQGSLDVVMPNGYVYRFKGTTKGPHAAIYIKTHRAMRALIFNSGLAFGEEWVNGEIGPIDCTLEDVLHVAMLNVQAMGHVFNRFESQGRFLARRIRQINGLRTSRRNVAHHYDLSKDLYKLFLDDDMQYSCAYFKEEGMSLEEAQREKKRHIAAKLHLDRPGLRVLDIGCGWGGMALTLAKDYGAHVTGITLSREQLAYARERAKAEGLEAQVQFELRDYRNVHVTFDRVVSVGMFEHVGVNNYRAFFEHIKACLHSEGVALVHSIGRMDGPGSTNPWINKYIFPGGYSPALSEVFPNVEAAGLWVADCEVLRLHYAKTIAIWRQRLAARRAEVVALYDERFYRIFEFYLTAAELSFRLQGHMNFQLQLIPQIENLPLTRDYMLAS